MVIDLIQVAIILMQVVNNLIQVAIQFIQMVIDLIQVVKREHVHAWDFLRLFQRPRSCHDQMRVSPNRFSASRKQTMKYACA